MSALNIVKIQPQTVLGVSGLDTLVVATQYQVNAQAGKIRVGVTLTSSAALASQNPNNGFSAQKEITTTDASLANVVELAVAATGYTVVTP